MDITRFALEKRVVTTAAIVLICLAGVMAYLQLPRAEDPGFVVRTALVTTRFPGASPERVELLVTDKLEKAIQEIPELDFVRSESKTGLSVIWVNVQERYTDMRPIWDNLRRKVERTASELPEGIIGPSVNDEFGDVFGIILTLTGEGYSYAELKKIADQVRDQLLRLGDVAKVEIHGAQDERVFIEYNNARLSEFGISPVQLRSILESSNIIIPGGSVQVGPERIALEPTGSFESLDDVRRTVIGLPGRSDLIYLEDLATVSRSYVDPPRSKMRCSGLPCLGLAVSMREGGNITELGKQVRPLVERLRQQYPRGVELAILMFQPDTVNRKVNEFAVNLLQSVGIVLLVMLVMLGLRTGLVVASLIPTTMIMTILVMSNVGIGLDQMSLASLIIALGMLVDNAIVMSESIMVQMGAGKPPVQAAVDSASELRIPLLTSSITTAAAFLPIYLAESSTGEYTSPLFTVVSITLLCSWLLALTMTPLLCVSFLRVKNIPEDSGYDSRFYRAYRGLLLLILRRRLLALVGIGGLFFLAMVGLQSLPSIFFPPSDKAVITAELELPLGTAIERSEEVVSAVEAFIQRDLVAGERRAEGIVNWGTFVGTGAPKFELSYNPQPSSPNFSFLLINATSQAVLGDVVGKLEEFCRQSFPEMKATIRPLSLGPPVTSPVQVRLSGEDVDTLFTLVEQTKEQLGQVPGTKNVSDDWGLRSKKLVIRIDEPRARRSGVTNQDIAVSLQTILSGLETTQYREGDKVIPVMLRTVTADRQDLGKLETLNVYALATGRSVPLKQVADIETVWEPARIFRRNRTKTVTVSSDAQAGFTANDINTALVPWLDAQQEKWGVGYDYQLGGEAETSGKATASIQEKLPIAGLIIAMCLVWQFNSLVRPLIIILTIPLALIGVSFGLVITGQYIGFMPFLGIIALAGIVINNAIVLIDRIKLEIEENGHPPARAIIEAAQRRLRPILLTTATTVAGLLPLWFGGGPLWEAMAIAIIFGLLFATVLTLGVVPLLYSLFFRVSFRGFTYGG